VQGKYSLSVRVQQVRIPLQRRVFSFIPLTVYPKVSGLAAWSEICEWYRSLPPLGTVI